MLDKIKKFACLVLAGVITLSGCSNPAPKAVMPSEEAKPLYEWGKVSGKTITVWGEGANLELPYVAEMFDRYEELTDNTIEYVKFTKAEVAEKMPGIYALDSGPRPDILVSFCGTSLETLKPEENFYDFTDAEWINDLTDLALNQSIYRGRVIGFPYNEAAISGTLYNKKIFEEYDLKVPTTQEEFLQVCEVLLKQGVTPVYLPYAEISMLLYQFPMSVFLQDSKILNGLNDGSITYAQIPEMKKIVEWYKTMSDRGYFGKDYLENNWAGMDGAMKSREYAMMLCWDTWLYDVYTGDATDFGLMPSFIGAPENGCFEGPNMLLFVANKKGANLDAALDLITFFADPYNYNYTFKGRHSAPVYKKQLGNIATPQYMEAERWIEKYYCNSTAWSRLKGFSQLDAVYIQDYMQGKCTLDECIENMDTARIERAGIKAQDPPDN